MNNDVLRIQKALKRLKFYSGPLDGLRGIKTEAGNSQYKVFKSKASKGPDISHYQTKVNFEDMAKEAGFVIIRTSASMSKDKLFKAHWDGAGKVGLKRTIYHFFAPWQDPIKQAELVAEILGDRKVDMPIILDVEALAPKAKKGQPAPKPVTTAVLISQAVKCAEALEILTGVPVIIYTYSAFSLEHKLGLALGKKFALWLADYRSGPSTVSEGWEHVVGHQWAGDNGTFVGVEGPCDCNYLEVPLESLLLNSGCQGPAEVSQSTSLPNH